MSTLDFLKKVKLKTINIESHLAKDLDDSLKKDYLRGISLVTDIDNLEDESVNKQKEYFSILLNTFKIDEDLDFFIDFIVNPVESTIIELINSLNKADNEYKYCFMIDVIILAMAGNYQKLEESIKEYSKMLMISKDMLEAFTVICKLIFNKKEKELKDYFKNDESYKNYFEYLINFYDLNINE